MKVSCQSFRWRVGLTPSPLSCACMCLFLCMQVLAVPTLPYKILPPLVSSWLLHHLLFPAQLLPETPGSAALVLLSAWSVSSTNSYPFSIFQCCLPVRAPQPSLRNPDDATVLLSHSHSSSYPLLPSPFSAQVKALAVWR